MALSPEAAGRRPAASAPPGLRGLSRARAARRGQATTEAALGFLAVVTVIVFGIHFSEVAMLTLKVQEANASALWDATGRKMHTFGTGTPDFSTRTQSVSQAMSDAMLRYADYDGRSSKGGNVSPTLVFTQASPVQITCQEVLGFVPLNMGGASMISNLYAAGQGAMSCIAEADFGLVPRFTRNFLENQPFRAQHVSIDTYHICAMGRANGNNCPAPTNILLGDWGFTDGTEGNNCDLIQPAPGLYCQNPGYHIMVETAFTKTVGNGQKAGEAFSQWLWKVQHGGPEIDVDENAVVLAAVGEDSNNPKPYQQIDQKDEHDGEAPYTVTPGGTKKGGKKGGGYSNPSLQLYEDASQTRDPCAFGLPCAKNKWPIY